MIQIHICVRCVCVCVYFCRLLQLTAMTDVAAVWVQLFSILVAVNATTLLLMQHFVMMNDNLEIIFSWLWRTTSYFGSIYENYVIVAHF